VDDHCFKNFHSSDWLDNFRVGKEAFLYICNRLSGALVRQDTVMCLHLCATKSCYYIVVFSYSI